MGYLIPLDTWGTVERFTTCFIQRIIDHLLCSSFVFRRDSSKTSLFIRKHDPECFHMHHLLSRRPNEPQHRSAGRAAASPKAVLSLFKPSLLPTSSYCGKP